MELLVTKWGSVVAYLAVFSWTDNSKPQLWAIYFVISFSSLCKNPRIVQQLPEYVNSTVRKFLSAGANLNKKSWKLILHPVGNKQRTRT